MTVKTDASRIKAQQRSLASAELAFTAIEAGYANGTHSIVGMLFLRVILGATEK